MQWGGVLQTWQFSSLTSTTKTGHRRINERSVCARELLARHIPDSKDPASDAIPSKPQRHRLYIPASITGVAALATMRRKTVGAALRKYNVIGAAATRQQASSAPPLCQLGPSASRVCQQASSAPPLYTSQYHLRWRRHYMPASIIGTAALYQQTPPASPL